MDRSRGNSHVMKRGLVDRNNCDYLEEGVARTWDTTLGNVAGIIKSWVIPRNIIIKLRPHRSSQIFSQLRPVKSQSVKTSSITPNLALKSIPKLPKSIPCLTSAQSCSSLQPVLNLNIHTTQTHAEKSSRALNPCPVLKTQPLIRSKLGLPNPHKLSHKCI
ncbi:unnamed protein product [Allacma fusca]|uniref:Uncharacterized protein n=1 Tax=Allacma fusca TaxID=39272 RepID=A0A8J2K063_9HEXA|nr:unnamed protein product [Allacma fusca]